jgi:uncharacterized small protein (DUF1192 family)
MAIFDDESAKKPKPHEIGQDLSLLSAGELSERIALLREENARRGRTRRQEQHQVGGGGAVSPRLVASTAACRRKA